MISFWHQSPLIRVAISFISGIGIGNIIPNHPKSYPILVGLFVLIVLVLFWYKAKRQSHRHRYQFGFILLFGFLVAGALMFSIQQFKRVAESILPKGERVWIAEVNNYPHPTRKSIKLELSILASRNDSGDVRVETINVLAYGRKQAGWDTLIPGDQIVFSSEFTQFGSPINPGQFDYGKYLQNHRISGMAFLKDDALAIRPLQQGFSLRYLLLRVQSFFVHQMGKHHMDARELGVASALILGKRSLVDKDVKDNFADAGVVHILAVSGLHVGIIYLILIWILGFFFKGEKWKWLKLGLIILLLWMYAGITGLSPSVMRAATMFSFVAVGKEKGKRGSIYNMLAVSAIVLLVVDPYLLFEVGFQLSYAAVIGIAMFYTPIYSLYYVKNKWLDKVWSLIVVSFSAQLATFPLAIYYFDQFPNYFLLSNLFVIPLATLGLYAGLILIAFSWIPYVGEFISQVVEWIFWLLISVVDVLAKLPMAKMEYLHIGIAAVIFTYALIYFLYKFFQSPNKWKIWWPIGMATILIFLYAQRKYQIYCTSEIVLLEGSQQPIVLYQNGNEGVVFSNLPADSVLKNEDYYLSGYREVKGIEHLKIVDTNDFDLPFHVDSSEGAIRFNYSKNSQIPWLNYDGIRILSRVESMNNENILVVIPSNVKPYQNQLLTAHLTKINQPFWDMSKEGVLKIQVMAK